MCRGECEWGICDVCGKYSPLERTYFGYDIKCECHSPNHFELVHHCSNCVPVEPEYTKVTMKTSSLKRLEV